MASMPRTRGHLDVDVHAVVREHDHHLRALARGLVDRLLHASSWMPKLQFGDKVARVGDRCVGKGLADDGHGHAVDV
jgi:hypothetical protein